MIASRASFGRLKPGAVLNLERALKWNKRIDGHFVQGHVDAMGKIISVQEEGGSWRYTISFDPAFAQLIVSKGSICVNGVSLTVVDPGQDTFSVAIIPFTFEHTNFHQLKKGDAVNLEFDILGKYILRKFS